jgi:ApbE superfamily uncharacterized protein (UPF0280 family)
VRPPADYADRTTYRRRVRRGDLCAFRVACQQTDLMILAERCLERFAREQTLHCRGHIENYIQRHPEFATTLVPWSPETVAPAIVREMVRAGRAAGVGPMAAVAGAVAETVGRALLTVSRQVVVENGGDVFIKTDRPAVAALFAGGSPLSMKLGVQVADTGAGVGMCTSSGTVGHSFSKGAADAVCVLSSSCALADAAATAIGNCIRSPQDIPAAIAFGRRIDGIDGIVVVAGAKIGAWGALELVPLAGKKG